MICPLCQKELIMTPAYYTTNIDPYDFHCTTFVDSTTKNAKWLHYDRSTRDRVVLYCAIIPPFRIMWHPNKDFLRVDKFATNEIVYEQKQLNVDYDIYVKTCLRFKNLKVFI